MLTLTPEQALREWARRWRTRRLYVYKPYPKQYEFHKAGLIFRRRLLMAANRVGKTRAAGNEFAMHMTGQYPDWWPGVRYDKPTMCWALTETNELSRDVVQFELLGTTETDIMHPNVGTGAIPRDMLVKITRRQAGVTDVVDQIVTRHVSGGFSTAALKTYEQGRTAIQGKKVHFAWADEEPPEDVDGELVTRIQTERNGRVALTFTPMKGTTEVVDSFLNPKLGDEPKSVTNMTIWDAVGGVWPEDSPWSNDEWKGHYTKDQVTEIIASYKPHERRTRSLGIPMAGSGLVWPIEPETLRCTPFEMPDASSWRYILGIDFGIGHPAAVAALAHDLASDTIYLYSLTRKADLTRADHAHAINRMGKWIPVAWPHDGMTRDPRSGTPLADLYRGEFGVNMLPDSARYDDDHGGAQSPEGVIAELEERMLQGKFKVFPGCEDFLTEMRTFHRGKDTKPVQKNDDAIKAVIYAVMMLRHARPKTLRLGLRAMPPQLEQWAP